MRYFVWFAYDGTDYHGWQIQPHENSVQAELQRALSILLREPVAVVGAGRTDTGVHARSMAAHFDIGKTVDCQQLAYKLNRLLPKDIAVYKVEQVDGDMHARFSAKSRTYHYYVHKRKNPFLRNYSCQLHYNLDFELMNKAAELLLRYDDFGAFCKSHTDVKTTLCNVTEARWIEIQDKEAHTDGADSYDTASQWYFRITANRFLRNMVRAVVGTLIEVGRGRMTLEEFQKVIEGKSRSEAGESMPGHALFLEKVVY